MSFLAPCTWRQKFVNGKCILSYETWIFYCIHQMWRYCIKLCDYTRFTTLQKKGQMPKFHYCTTEDKSTTNKCVVWYGITVGKPKCHNGCNNLYSFFENLRTQCLLPLKTPTSPKRVMLLSPIQKGLKVLGLTASALCTRLSDRRKRSGAIAGFYPITDLSLPVYVSLPRCKYRQCKTLNVISGLWRWNPLLVKRKKDQAISTF